MAGFRAGWKGLAGERHQEFAQIRCDQLRRRIRSHRRIHAGVRTHRRRAHRLNGYGQQPPWQPRPLSPQERMQMLDQAIFGLASRGGRLLTRTEWNAVVVMGKPVNHVLHLILTLLSLCCCGIWAPVWLLITAFGGEHREILSVDQYGQVSQQRGPMETWRKVLIGVAVAFLVLWFIGAIMAAIERSHQSTSTGSRAPRQLTGPAVANVAHIQAQPPREFSQFPM